jgi:protein-L-isoaspartate(D-aspartate) O-methyltransferase
LQKEAYGDWPLPIGFGQTISQPFTVAYMIEALKLHASERVLEIGTGSGYAAAVLSCVAADVHTIERIPELAEMAQKRLADLGFHNVQVHLANGTLGLPDHAPFDAIVVTAGAGALPEPYAEQLAEGGRIVIPIGAAPTSQTLFRYTRRGEQLHAEGLGEFAFVPLVGEHGWHDPSE